MDVKINSKLLLFVIAGLIVSSYYANDIFADEKNSVGQIKWLETNYSSTGTAIVQLVDPDMDLNPEKVDNFDVDVWSDTDFAGIDLTMTETGDATGIFEGTVFFSTVDNTSGHRLRVSQGDTIYSKYDDYTLPEFFNVDKIDLISTASIHGTITIIEDRVSFDKKSYQWNDEIIITITAPEENIDGESIEIIDLSKNSIKISTRHFGIDTYNLVETGTDSGIFVGKIILVDKFSDIDSDGISVFYEYEEDKVAIGSAPIILNPESSNFTDEQICGPGTEFVNGVCHIIETYKEHSAPMPKFIDALFFMLIVLPFFIPGTIIFVVLSKTPRFSREIRLTVCIPAIIMILYFLSGLYLGWYPPGYA